MDLTSQLIPTLVCLLAFTSTFVHGQNFNIRLREIIKTLNILTARNVSKLSGTISPDVLVMPWVFLRLWEEHHDFQRSRCLVTDRELCGDFSAGALWSWGMVASLLGWREGELPSKDHSVLSEVTLSLALSRSCWGQDSCMELTVMDVLAAPKVRDYHRVCFGRWETWERKAARFWFEQETSLTQKVNGPNFL